MDKIWMKYVGPRYGGGVVEDFEHTKIYWGPENDWQAEVPVRLAGMIIQEKGIDMFMPCLPPGLGNIEELQDKIIALTEENKDLRKRLSTPPISAKPSVSIKPEVKKRKKRG